MSTMTLFTDTFRTPFGPFSIAVTESGSVAATAFGNVESLLRRLPLFHVIHEKTSMPSPPAKEGLKTFHVIRENGPIRAAREQVLAYFAGERLHFDLPIAPEGSVFQQRVWAALRQIPFGATRSYGELAREIASAPRAVGRANATNPICLIVPCHRVIGADGSLTGFAFGEEIKRRLLEHERAMALRPRAA